MANLTQLRIAAREIFDQALRAIDPASAMRANLRLDGTSLRVGEMSTDIDDQNIYSIAIGKAAARMAIGLNEILGQRFSGGVLTTSDLRISANQLGNKWRVFHGGHPEPNESSLAAAQAAFELIDCANREQATLIFLISGGGSAMLEWPINENISLAELRIANSVLVNCGASISEINSVRRAFSAVKGGRLAGRAPDCDQITLIVSDVPDGEERNVASGPTVTPPGDVPDARDVAARYHLSSLLPATILQAIENARPLEPAPQAMREQFVLLKNSDALHAAAQAAQERGFITQIASDISDQPVEEGCGLLVERLEALRAKNKARNPLAARPASPVGTSADSKLKRSVVCLISGGEFACPVQGDGIGGRNLESALRLSQRMISSGSVAVCAGTDGIDGNSPAAGAIVDETTIDRATAVGLNAEAFLRRSDSYSFFVALGDVMATGPTGTNVRDLRILLAAD